MALTQVRSTSPITSWEWSEGAITVAVTSGGSDTAVLGRPDKLLSGDYSATPFATPAAALSALPKGLRHDVIMTIGAGTFAGFAVHGFVGKGKLRIAGSTALATLATGTNNGTANSGTTTTSLVKPGAAANWTVDDLRGHFLIITAGGGNSGDSNFPTIRPIKSNTTTTLTVDAITGMDNTSVFQIVDIASIFTNAVDTPYGLTVRTAFVQNLARIEASKLKADESSGNYANLLWDCASVSLNGCHFLSSSGWASKMIGCTEATLGNVLAEGRINPTNSLYVAMPNMVVQADGFVDSQYITNHTLNVDALECTGTAVKIQDCVSVIAGINANDCDVTPVDLQNIHNFQISGGLTGTNPTPERGILFSRGGQYIITGATISGSESDEFELDGRPGSYFELSGVNSGTYANRGTYLHWGSTGYTVWQCKLRIEGGEVGDDFDEFITNNMVIGGIVKHYGAWQSLDPAYKQITAFATGGQTSATPVGYRDTYVVNVVSPGDSIRLLSSSEIAYAGGLIGSVYNGGAEPLDLFPPSGKRLYMNGNSDLGVDTALSVLPGSWVVWIARNDLDYGIFVLPAYAVEGFNTAYANTIPRQFDTSGRRLKTSNIVIEDGDQMFNYRAKRTIQSGTTYTLVAYDSGTIIEFDNPAGCTVTVPDDLFDDFCVTLVQKDSGAVTVVGDTGVDIDNVDAQFSTGGTFAMCTLYRTQDDTNQKFIFAGRTA